MREQGITPTNVSCAALMNGYIKQKNLERAEIFYLVMEKEGVQPSVEVCNVLISGYAKQRKIQKAEKLFEMMQRQKMDINVVTYNSLLSGYVKNKNVEKAEKLFEKMEKNGINPNHITYTTLFDEYVQLNMMEKAEKIFEMMTNQKIVPDAYCNSSLVYGFRKAGNMKKALKYFIEIIKQIEETTGNFDYDILFGSQKDQQILNGNKIVKILKETQENSIFSKEVLHFIIDGFCKTDNLDGAVQILEMMLNRKIHPKNPTIFTTITRYIATKKKRSALQLVEKIVQNGIRFDSSLQQLIATSHTK